MAYNRFRYYSTESGTYISQDPIGLSGSMANFYAYVPDINSWVDQFGLEAGIITVLLQAEGSHFGVITDGSSGMMTDLNQLGDLDIGTNEEAIINKNSDLYEFNKYANFEVDDIDAAKKMQLDEMAKGKFKYKRGVDDCLTHVAKVLEAGGVDVTPSNARRFMMLNRNKFKEISCG